MDSSHSPKRMPISKLQEILRVYRNSGEVRRALFNPSFTPSTPDLPVPSGPNSSSCSSSPFCKDLNLDKDLDEMKIQGAGKFSKFGVHPPDAPVASNSTAFDDVDHSNIVSSTVFKDRNRSKVHDDKQQAHKLVNARAFNVKLCSSPPSSYLPAFEPEVPWNDFFMGLCFLTSSRGKNSIPKVGACIIDQENRVISLGFNSTPRVCHAVMNAIMNGRKVSFENCCLYVTRFPCSGCAKLIIEAGIRQVIFAEREPEPCQGQVCSYKMLTLAGVIYKRFIPSVSRWGFDVTQGNGHVYIINE